MANTITGPLRKTGRSAAALLVYAILAALVTWFLFPSSSAAGSDRFYGMVVGPQVDINRAVPKLEALGVNTVRLRTSVRDWGRPEANTGGEDYDAAFVQAKVLDDAGFRVVLQISSEGGAMPSYGRARTLFEWMMTRDGAKSVDVFEIFGPVTEQAANADAFSTTFTRAQQAQRYVDGPLKAAWDVFHSDARKKVLGGAFTPYQQVVDGRPAGAATLAVTQAYVRAGYLKRVDYAGFHPDQPTPGAQVAWVRRAVGLFGDKPVWVSEWQLNRNAFGSDGEYLDAMTATLPDLRATVGAACYSGFTGAEGVVPVAEGGLGGYQERDPAFDTYRSWPKD